MVRAELVAQGIMDSRSAIPRKVEHLFRNNGDVDLVELLSTCTAVQRTMERSGVASYLGDDLAEQLVWLAKRWSEKDFAGVRFRPKIHAKPARKSPAGLPSSTQNMKWPRKGLRIGLRG